ncbi:MAG: hypothetical protein AAGI14_11930 [Pseudomonadota bacterium]
MHRILTILVLIIGLAPALVAQTLLEVEVTEIEFTEYQPVHDEDVLMMSSWHILDANVLNVISGDYDEETIKFAQLMSTPYQTPLRVYVYIDEFTNTETTGLLKTPYYSVEMISPESIICFSDHAPMPEDLDEYRTITVEDQNCFHEDDLDRFADAQE